MSIDAEDAVASAPSSLIGRVVCAARVRWAHRALDVQLAEERNPWSSAALSKRAALLASLEERRRVARSLVSLVRLAELGPASRCLRLRWACVLDHQDALLGLAARLHAEEPVDVATVAELTLLVRDANSPLFEGGPPAGLVPSILGRCVGRIGADACLLRGNVVPPEA